jgi:Holliday junction resolvase RusA-like endonuclease
MKDKGAANNISLFFWLAGRIVPKARPRLSSGRAILPQNYREWKNGAIASLIRQKEQGVSLPINCARIEIELSGSHLGDLDNIAGAILDALVQAGIIKDDRLSCIYGLSICVRQPKNLTAVPRLGGNLPGDRLAYLGAERRKQPQENTGGAILIISS